MRWEVPVLYGTLIGPLILDISMEYHGLLSSDSASFLHHTRDYFNYNMGPTGFVALTPVFIVLAVLALLYRLVTERKLIDVFIAVLVAYVIYFFKVNVEEVESGLNLLNDEDLRKRLTLLSAGHMGLLVFLFVGVVLQLFASPPKVDDHIELFPMAIAVGMLLLDLTYDIPVMLSLKNADVNAAFVNNTCHIHTFCHEMVIPAIFGFIGIKTLVRTISCRRWQDILSILIFVIAGVAFFIFVEPHEKKNGQCWET